MKRSLQRNLYQYLSSASYVFWMLLFPFGSHMGSHPQEGAASTVGQRTLMPYMPTSYAGNRDIFWLATGAVIVIFSLENTLYLQRVFTTRIAQDLGDISFSIYMLHAQVIFTMGQCLVSKCMNLTGGWANGQLGFGAGMLLALFILIPFTFWVSGFFFETR
jgi:hypothetical protein